jgi:hypothetical protein
MGSAKISRGAETEIWRRKEDSRLCEVAKDLVLEVETLKGDKEIVDEVDDDNNDNDNDNDDDDEEINQEEADGGGDTWIRATWKQPKVWGDEEGDPLRPGHKRKKLPPERGHCSIKFTLGAWIDHEMRWSARISRSLAEFVFVINIGEKEKKNKRAELIRTW